MVKERDMSKIKNWIEGDTFAVKIENCSKEYNGRYLILIRRDYPLHLYKNTYLHFNAKITKEKKIPRTVEEIDNLDYIKTFFFSYYSKNLYGCKEINQAYLKPDEYEYIYTYIFEIWLKRGGNKDIFQYLGNFQIIPPENEFVPNLSNTYFLPDTYKWTHDFNFMTKLIDNYSLYNLKKCEAFTDESKNELKNRAQWETKIFKLAEEHPEVFSGIKRTHVNAWGDGIYQSDIALDVKDDYLDLLKESKKNGTSNEKMVEELIENYEDEIDDEYDGPVFWIVLANEQMKRKKLTKYQKAKGLEAIEKDLKNWKKEEIHQNREKCLNRLKKKLEAYECEK